MTVTANQDNRYSYSGDDTTKAFSYGSKFLADADLVVLVVAADGTVTTKTLTTDYTVTGAGDDTGGTVTFGTAPAAGETVVIFNDPEIEQPVDLVDNDGFEADTVEGAFDRAILIERRTRELTNRTLVQSDADTDAIATLPVKADREVSVLAFDSNGDPVSPSGNAGQFLRKNAAGTAIEFATVQAGDSVVSATEIQEGIAEIATQTETDTGTDDTRFVTPKKVAATLTNWYSTAKNFLASGTDAVSRTVRDKLRDTVSVQDFGAVGDGTTDDVTAIQAAIDSVGTNGGHIIFPAATYKIGSTLTIQKSNVTLDFRNGARLSLPASDNAIEISGSVENIKIKGAYFDGDTDSVAIHGIGINDMLVVEGCYFNGGSKGIYLVSGSSTTGSYGSHIRDCVFNAQTAKGIHIAPVSIGFAQAHFVTDCAFFGSIQDLFATSGSGIFVSHCRFERIAALTNSVAKIHVDTCNKFVLRDCYIEEGHNAVACVEIGSTVDNIIIEGNYFTLGDDGTTDQVKVLDLSGTAANNVIFDSNYISHAGTTTTLIDFGASTRVRAHNNTIGAGTLTNAFNGTAADALLDIAANKFSGTITNNVSGVVQGAMQAAAWAKYNGNSASLNAHFNISSVTRNAAGDYTFNFARSMASANYAAIASGNAPSNGTNVCVATVISQTADAVRVNIAATGGGTGGLTDSSLVNLIVFGQLS